MTWQNLTVEQYQYVYQVMQQKDLNELELSSRLVGIIYGVTDEDIDKMSVGKFNECCAAINKMLNTEIPGKARKYIKANGRYYKPQYFVNKFNFGQYAEAKAFSGDWIENMHKVMATICEHKVIFGKSKLTHEERAEDLLQAKFIDVYHTCLFFWEVYKNSMKGIRVYMETEMSKSMTRAEAQTAYNSLIDGLDGFTTPR